MATIFLFSIGNHNPSITTSTALDTSLSFQDFLSVYGRMKVCKAKRIKAVAL